MLRLTRHGWKEMLIGSIVLVAIGVLAGWLAGWWAGLLVLPVLVWLFAFFRDPHRVIPSDPGLLVSPADGLVTDIREFDHIEELGGPGTRVGIFLSVFNVHVNRSPCACRVLSITYKPGLFASALKHDEASMKNESNTVVLGDAQGRPIVAVKQISGLIARRIVCTVKIGDELARGQHIGMIKFGSRTELYIARHLSPQVRVSVGQKVHGGSDIIASVATGEGVGETGAMVA
jgi:phosphatidylserine decarboxylase